MDVCKCKMSLRYGVTVKRRPATSFLMRWVRGEERILIESRISLGWKFEHLDVRPDAVHGPPPPCKMVRRWCRQFSEGCQSVDYEERSRRPALINVDLVELVRQYLMANHRFTITELSSQFPQIS
ncbi:hypothetical protein TNCV_209761 [Trichonephila clavipes]|uniref:Mos1 transposase HTH domain-containing protein n=1 Tax=Trichonephila clavipes TaxID=2585209 RepID=A0A8X6VNK0_TRICX|nr:hypothetical protein TNCV_209761 [Trichonephila clavipes]